MIILGFETANFGASISLVKDGKVLGQKCFEQSHGHAGFLIPELQGLLKEHGIPWSAVEAFVTTTGPGSFTGVRLSLATARTLRSVSQAPVLGVPTPFWLVQSFLKTRAKDSIDLAQDLLLPFLVCLEARREDLYCQLFDASGAPLKEIVNILPKDIPKYIGGPCYGLGNGLGRLVDPQEDESSPVKPCDYSPTAEDLCLLAEDILHTGKAETFPLTPLYVRDPDICLPKKK